MGQASGSAHADRDSRRSGPGLAVLVGNRQRRPAAFAVIALDAPSRQGVLHIQFLSQMVLIGLMLAASMIDVDEKTFPTKSPSLAR